MVSGVHLRWSESSNVVVAKAVRSGLAEHMQAMEDQPRSSLNSQQSIWPRGNDNVIWGNVSM